MGYETCAALITSEASEKELLYQASLYGQERSQYEASILSSFIESPDALYRHEGYVLRIWMLENWNEENDGPASFIDNLVGCDMGAYDLLTYSHVKGSITQTSERLQSPFDLKVTQTCEDHCFFEFRLPDGTVKNTFMFSGMLTKFANRLIDGNDTGVRSEAESDLVIVQAADSRDLPLFYKSLIDDKLPEIELTRKDQARYGAYLHRLCIEEPRKIVVASQSRSLVNGLRCSIRHHSDIKRVKCRVLFIDDKGCEQFCLFDEQGDFSQCSTAYAMFNPDAALAARFL